MTEAVRLNSNNADAYGLLGWAYTNTKQYEKAVITFTEHLRLKPAEFGFLYARATAYTYSKQFEKALADLDEFIHHSAEESSDRAVAHLQKAQIYNQTKQYQSAVADASEAIRLKNGFVEAYDSRAWAYDGLKQYAKAIADFRKYLELAPNGSGVEADRKRLAELEKIK